jgi:hypothetical protein
MQADEASPSAAKRLFNKLSRGAKYKSVFAEKSGEILIPMGQTKESKSIKSASRDVMD